MKILNLALLGLLLSCCCLLCAHVSINPTLFSKSTLVEDDLPCQFSWNAVTNEYGNEKNFVEDKGCQPYQGPCVAFSFVKAMEAYLNIQGNLACVGYNFSIPYLDYAGWEVDDIISLLDNGFGIPEELLTIPDSGGETMLCGNFGAYGCNTQEMHPICYCHPALLQNGPIAEDLCFSVALNSADPELSDDWTCEDGWWNIQSFPMTQYKMQTRGINHLNDDITSIQILKSKILCDGPLVVIIHQVPVLNNLRNYGSLDDVNFHSFVLTGWEYNDNGKVETIWNIDDHWPDNPQLCGPGQTLKINNAELLGYLHDNSTPSHNSIEIYTVGHPTISEVGGQIVECYEGGAFEFDIADQNNCCISPPASYAAPTIVDISFAGECLERDGMNPMVATVDCNGPEAFEYEWTVNPGMYGQPSHHPCHSNCIVIPNAETVFVKVRARQKCGTWGDWYHEEFCVQGKGGNGEGPNTLVPIKY